MPTRRKTAPKPVEPESVIETESEKLTEESFEFVELVLEPDPEPEPAPELPVSAIPDPKPTPPARRRNVPRFTQVK